MTDVSHTVKNPEERKNELIAVSEKLFVEKGYENTLVSEIVSRAGVAQGTFYYYFKSKEDVYYAILENKLSDFAENIEELAGNDEKPIQKLQHIFTQMFSYRGYDEVRLQYLNNTQSSILHEKWDEARRKRILPILLSIVKEGVMDGSFPMSNPDVITEVVFLGINQFMHIHYHTFHDRNAYITAMRGLEEILARALGIPEGTIKFIRFMEGEAY